MPSEELERAVRELVVNKSCGIDGIYGKHMLYSSHVLFRLPEVFLFISSDYLFIGTNTSEYVYDGEGYILVPLQERIDFGRETFLLELQHYLQGQTAQNHPFEAYINFDVFHKLFETATPTPAAVRRYKAYQHSDFDGADLPVWWDRIVNKDHYGRCFVFPILMRQILSWSPVN